MPFLWPLETLETWPWVESVFENKPELTAAQCARLLLLTRDYPRAWEEAETRGRDVADAFWLNVMPYGPGLDFAAVEHVASRMMQVGRNASALDFIGMYICRDNSDQAEAAVLVVQGLNGLLEKIDDPGLPSLSQYDFDSLFGLLELHRDALGHDEVGRHIGLTFSVRSSLHDVVGRSISLMGSSG